MDCNETISEKDQLMLHVEGPCVSSMNASTQQPSKPT